MLENLGEPELLRSPKAVVVKGCDPIETPEAMQLCPQFFCEKALLDANVVPRSSRFEVTAQRRASAVELIGGIFRPADAAEQYFACVLENGAVKSKKIVTSAELKALAEASGGWSL